MISKTRAGSASASAAAAAAAKASAAVYHFYHAIVNGRERAVALAEVRIASARAAGASRMRLVELLGDLAAAHAGGGLSGSSPSPFDGRHDGAPPLPPAPPAVPSSSSSSSSASAASRALVLSRALDLIDPRDEWDWRASTPAALAALATGRAAALSSRSRSSGGSLSSSFAAASLSSSAEASSSPPSSSSSSLLDPRELRVRLSVGPSKGHVVSLAEMLSKPADWFIATMGEFGAATARALSRLREDPAAIGEWLGGREGQSGLRHASRLCSELRAFSPAWAASDVATAMETCMLSGFADEEGHYLSSSSCSAAAAAGGGGGVSDADGGDGDDRDNAIRDERSDLEDTGGGDVDAEGISGGGEEGGLGGEGAEGEERRGNTSARRRRRRRPSSSASAASPPAPSASSSLPSRAELSVVLEAMCLSEEQRRTVVGLRRIYLRKRRAAAQARAEALATLRGLLLLAPEKDAECGGGGGDKGSADGTNNIKGRSEKAGAPTAAETPTQQQARGRRGAANDIGRGAYVRALAAAAALSAAAAADAWAETEISIRVSSMCTRAQGAIYNGLVYPRPHCVPSFAELVAEQAGEPPAEAILSGAVET